MDYTRIFPEGDHRWSFGLRSAESAARLFFPWDATGAMLRERAHWLDTDPEEYAALMPEAQDALRETANLARQWGFLDNGETGSDEALSPDEQLLQLGRVWEPDFVWMHPDSQGQYRLTGGVVCFPSSWALREKLGRPMHEIHDPVPALNSTLGRQIDAFLTRLAPLTPWSRENWSLSRDAELNYHPSLARARLDASVPPETIQIRLEHQLLMKLPKSGSILFGMRLEIIPIHQVKQDPIAATRVAHLLTTMDAEAATYKSLSGVRDALVDYLRA